MGLFLFLIFRDVERKSMKNRLWLWSLIAALAGFLFGFDTVVISGADQALQALWNSSDGFHGWVVMSSALWGTVVGAIFGNVPTDKLGRKKTLILIGCLYTISALGSAFSSDPYVFAIMRFLGGIGVGVSTVAAPAYISEIAPASDRGKLTALYQFNIVLGILIAFISNYLLSTIAVDAWRWMVGVEAVPAVIYTLLACIIPRSPRWVYIYARQKREAERILEKIYPQAEVQKQLEAMTLNVTGHKTERLFQKKYLIPLSLAFFISFFNQFSGINAFLYYAPRIFETAGLGESTALLSSIGIGVVNLIFTLLGVYLIDRLGRKQLLTIGGIGYVVSLSLVAAAFLLEWTGILVPTFLFLFIAAHAIGQGAVIWVCLLYTSDAADE